MSPIDLRSDTVTRPDAGMRRAMAEAEVGDDFLDGDPTTRRLEERIAALLGHEAALFFPSGIQANQIAAGMLAGPGEELILEAQAHMLDYEMGALTSLWGIQPRPVPTPDGLLTADLVAAAFRSGRYLPRTAAIAVENTHNGGGGLVMPEATLADIAEVAAGHGVGLHLDGARLWNAAVALGVAPGALARHATTVMVSLSKGLGCPVGSCLAGSHALMERAWVLRRRLGGAMRQSGVLTAAALYALDHHLDGIAEDHANARRLADALAGHSQVRAQAPDSNIVMLDILGWSTADAVSRLAARGVLLVSFGATRLRAVTHRDVNAAAIAEAAATIADVLSGGPETVRAS